MPLTARFSEALALACELHREQYRKASDVPYVAHLLSVAALVLEHGGSEDEAIAALLHDAVEDQGGPATQALIERRFGPQVAGIVAGCTDTDQTPKPPWRKRKEDYLAHLAVADSSVRLVSAADKLHNLRSLLHDYRAVGESLWHRFSGGKEGTLWYYREVVEVLSVNADSPLSGELRRALQQLQELVAAGE